MSCFIRIIPIDGFILIINDSALSDIYTLSLHDALPIWMPDRTEANPNELNQDDARYGFRCCHLKNITSIILIDRKSGSAGMPRPISYAVSCLKKKKQPAIIQKKIFNRTICNKHTVTVRQ